MSRAIRLIQAELIELRFPIRTAKFHLIASSLRLASEEKKIDASGGYEQFAKFAADEKSKGVFSKILSIFKGVKEGTQELFQKAGIAYAEAEKKGRSFLSKIPGVGKFASALPTSFYVRLGLMVALGLIAGHMFSGHDENSSGSEQVSDGHSAPDAHAPDHQNSEQIHSDSGSSVAPDTGVDQAVVEKLQGMAKKLNDGIASGKLKGSNSQAILFEYAKTIARYIDEGKLTESKGLDILNQVDALSHTHKASTLLDLASQAIDMDAKAKAMSGI